MSKTLSGKKIVLCLTGSIACYKACELLRELTKLGAFVHVAMTKSAMNFVGPATLQALSGKKVLCDLFDSENTANHIQLMREADLFVVAPATANIIGKFVAGICDDAVSTLFVAAKCKTLIAPAMHEEMWLNNIVQDNVKKLREFGVIFVGPETGDLACGDVGEGRFASKELLVNQVEFLLNKKDFLQKRVLLSVGPTYEAIDSVRYISNWSSGKMGIALAKELYLRGAKVTVISSLPAGNFAFVDKFIAIKTAQQMAEAVKKNLKEADVFISSAAIADFRPLRTSLKKIPKKELKSLELTENEDVLASVSKIKGKRKFAGFILESKLDEAKVKAKMTKKGLDLAIAVTEKAFAVDDIEAQMYTKKGKVDEFIGTKGEFAKVICDFLA